MDKKDVGMTSPVESIVLNSMMLFGYIGFVPAAQRGYTAEIPLMIEVYPQFQIYKDCIV